MVGTLGVIGFLGTIGLWLIWSAVNGVVAQEKGRSGLMVGLFSLIFSPFLGYLYILAVPEKKG
jgi:hypothetical protein